MDSAIADRIQFAFTVMFHYLFPIATMGIAPFIAAFSLLHAKTHDPRYAAAARFWTKIFAINFAIGVVTGIPLEFEFGTNWAGFSDQAGAVIGQPLAMEGVYAFFLESVFLGILLYGEGRVTPAVHRLSAVLVTLGAWLSGFFIVVTDGWMQHPVGYAISPDGRFALTSLAAVLFSPFALWQYAHVLDGALLTGGFVVAGVGAFYLLAGRHDDVARLFVRSGVVVAVVFSVMAIFPTGDRNGSNVTSYQPVKLAAMEGLFESEHGAPLAIIGMPDTRAGKLIDPVFVPKALSFLAYGSFNAGVEGLNAYSRDLWPPVDLTYYAYHVMVGLGTLFVALAAIAVLQLWRGTLFRSRAVLWALMLMMPFPYIANEAGWVAAEVGRQPWLIYGLLRTPAGISANVNAGEVVFTTIGFAGMYFLLGVLFIHLVLHEIAAGPSNEAVSARLSGAQR